MSTTDFNDMRSHGFEMPFHKRLHSKKKSLRTTLRSASDYLFKFHAIERMEERSLFSNDVETILQNGRITGLSRRVGFFLCPGEIPKTKAFRKNLLRLQDTIVITEGNKPVVVTVINNWTRWKKLIYQTAPFVSYSPSHWKYHTKPKQSALRFRSPYSYLYTFESVQQKEALGVSVADIKKIVRHGRYFVTENYLYLYTIRMLPVQDDGQVRAEGTAVVVKKSRPVVVAILRAYVPPVAPAQKTLVH